MGMELRPQLTIRGLRVRAVDAPMDKPVQTAAGPISSAPRFLRHPYGRRMHRIGLRAVRRFALA